ncbi:MAG TPA: diaminopimelate epimerase [Candidatus Brocadiia bacterium]|nr:diaminopimelate epimerase [Candidatus Brocadiia bacterium]
MIEGGLPFWKMEGAGNDLPLVDARAERRPETRDWPALARRMCDRRFGVGGDGLMALEPSSRGAALARMFNPDGTEDFCGNGLRCVAAYLCHRGEGADVVIETPRGLHRARTTAAGAREYEVDVEIMEPRFDAAGVPALAQGEMVERVLDLRDVKRVATSVGMGTTHTVIFSGEEVSEAEFLRDSPRIETLALFPDRTSVLWARVVSPERVEMRIWERGVGETLALRR